MKTNGQRAYEAYFAKAGGKSLVPGVALPSWEDQKAEIKASWEAAAGAVQPQFEAMQYVRRSDDSSVMDQATVEQMFRRFAEEATAEAEDPQNPVPRFGTPEYQQWVAKNVAQTPPSVHRLLVLYRNLVERLQAQLAAATNEAGRDIYEADGEIIAAHRVLDNGVPRERNGHALPLAQRIEEALGGETMGRGPRE